MAKDLSKTATAGNARTEGSISQIREKIAEIERIEHTCSSGEFCSLTKRLWELVDIVRGDVKGSPHGRPIGRLE